ncbi:hypothetical protein ABZ805_28150, partial [Saccharopolyspora sp. NPDC047091]
MLRVAVPNKGSLSGPAIQLLSDAGYRVHREHKALFATDTANDVQFVFLRPTDIARTVGSGVLDVGITGQALGAVGAWIGCRRRGVPLPAFADAIAPALI